MKKIAVLAVLVLCISAGRIGAQEKVVIGGSGSLQDEMRSLAKAYMAKNPSDSIEVMSERMSSTGGMEGVKLGRLTIGLVTDEPQGADKEKLVYTAVGRTPAAVAVNKSLPVSGLKEAQICSIFSGKIKSWKEVDGPDAKILVLTRKKDDANTGTMRERMGCFKTVQIAQDAIALVRGSEVLDSLDKRPNTIGIVNMGTSFAQRQNIKALAIDGVPPGPDTVQSGKYKYFNERGVVTLGAPKGAAKRFLDFAASPEGHQIIEAMGVIPAK